MSFLLLVGDILTYWAHIQYYIVSVKLLQTENYNNEIATDMMGFGLFMKLTS